MNLKSFKLGLFGRRYIDTIYYFNEFRLSETNTPREIKKSLGGIYNFKKIKDKDILLSFFEDGEVSADIFSDLKNSCRTSVLTKLKNNNIHELPTNSLDWLHISYLDDIFNINKINTDVPISVDFCKDIERTRYLDLLKKCSIIFDSRERKHLYDNVDISTPVVLHDPNGCECIINKNVVISQDHEPLPNLHVNGAGDVFCGIFLSKYYNTSIEEALKTTCAETTKVLLNNEI